MYVGINEHRGRHVRIFGEAGDLKSNLEASHGVGTYVLTFCGCDVM
jgi:hypothetical protein